MSGLAEGRVPNELTSKLLASREQLAAVLDHVDEGVTVVARDGTFLYANAAAARLIGVDSVDDLLALGFDEARDRFAIFDEHGAAVEPADLPGRRAFTGEQPDDVVLRFRSAAGGDERVSVVRAVPGFDANGRVAFVVNLFREVTADRRRAERDEFLAEAAAVLASSLELDATLRSIAELAVPRLSDSCAVDLVGDDGRTLDRVTLVHVDAEKAELSWRLREIRPWTIDDPHGVGYVIRTGETELYPELPRDVVAETAGSEEALRIIEEVAPRSYLAVPIMLRGKAIGALSFTIGAGERRFTRDDAELALELAQRAGIAIDNARLFGETRRSEALLDALFAAAPVGLGVWDRDLRFVRLNAALAHINGLPVEAHIGKRLEEVVPWLEPHVFETYRRVLATGEPAIDVESHDSGRSWLASYYPVRDRDGGVIGVGAVVNDVSDRRRAEQRLRVQHAVTKVLAEAESVDEAMPRVLAAICDLLDWDVGACWTVDADEAACQFVHAPPELEAFAAATLGHHVRRGVSLAGEIWEAREPRWVADMLARTDFPQAREAEETGVRAGFGFPAIAGGDVIALLEFFAREQRQPDPQLLDVVGALGRNVAQFIRRARAERERSRLLIAERQARASAEASAATLTKLELVSQVALEHLSLRDLLDSLLERIVDVLRGDSAAILLVDDSGEVLNVRATIGLEEELRAAIPVPLGRGLAGRVAASRQSLLVDDLDEIELVSPVMHERGIKSLIAIPLVVEDRVLGVLHCGSEQHGHFSYDDVRLLELIADRVTLAINQTVLYEAEREAQERLAFLGEASAVLGSSLDYEETLSAVARLVVPRLADWCSIDVLADDGTIQRVAVAHVDPDKVRWGWELHERFPPDPSADAGVPAVLRTGEPQLIPSVTEDMIAAALAERPELAEILDELSLHAVMTVPLVARGRTVGAISFVWAESGKTYDEDDLAFAQELAARAAVAVDNARLYRAAEEGRTRLGFLAEASALLGSSLHPEEALAELGVLVAGRVADWCSIHLADETGSPQLVTIVHSDPDKTAAARAYAESIEPDRDATSGVSKVIRTGEPELYTEIPPDLLSGPTREAGIHSIIIVPLLARGRTLGALTLVQAETEHKFTEVDLAFAEDIARRAAVAVDNAQLYREAQERAQAARVLASVGDGVLLLDANGVVRYWNRAAEAITGLSAAAVVDRQLADVLPGWAEIAERAPIGTDPAATPRAESLPLVVGQRELWLSIAGVAVADGVVYAFRDLTEERAVEEMKTEFVSTVSHELRTPLAAIYGAAMTLRRADVELAPDQSEKLLGVISNEADRLARTVNDVLYASRLDTDTLRVAIESCDALALTQDVVDAQRAHLPPGIDVQIDAPQPLPAVAADRDKVRQVLVNLVENAVKYSPDGGRVLVQLEPVGAHVRFVVADEGLGIPYAEQRRIFEKFYRLDPNMTRGIGGTGLGLYICRELIRRMHGRIWVTSEPGRGSTFSFELPIAGTDPDVVAQGKRLVAND